MYHLIHVKSHTYSKTNQENRKYINSQRQTQTDTSDCEISIFHAGHAALQLQNLLNQHGVVLLVWHALHFRDHYRHYTGDWYYHESVAHQVLQKFW